MSRAINLIVIHSAMPNGRPASVETIRKGHLARGFSDIGYHWVVCVMGTDCFSRGAWNVLKAKVKELQGRYPGVRIFGHRDFSPGLNGNGQVEPRWAVLRELPW